MIALYLCGVKLLMTQTMKTKLILTSVMACLCMTTQAQEVKEEIKGKAIVQVFGNLHSGFGSTKDDRGFELDRSYLGYEYKIGKQLSIKGVMDIGKSSDVSDYQRIAYIKNAMVTWKTGNLTISGGLISTTQFNYQEKAWGYRYIMKSFQDQYKFGSSADLGISAAYKFNDWISADAIIVNGEGYKKIQVNDGLNYGLGVTLTPVKGLSARIYGGLNEGSKEGQKNITNYALFLGYKNSKLSIGAEYNDMKNAGYVEDADKHGFSVYASGKLAKRTDIYARYDDLSAKSAYEESALLFGLQLKLGSYVKIAPNFRINMPKADGSDNLYSAYISCYFGL